MPALVLLAAEAQLLVAELAPGVDRSADKAFGARLVAYPLLVLAAPAGWWDDADHLVNRVLLLGGIGLLLAPGSVTHPRWVLVPLVTGLGSLLALASELGEWSTSTRHGTELATAYEDTLADMALGTVGPSSQGSCSRSAPPGVPPRVGDDPTAVERLGRAGVAVGEQAAEGVDAGA